MKLKSLVPFLRLKKKTSNPTVANGSQASSTSTPQHPPKHKGQQFSSNIASSSSSKQNDKPQDIPRERAWIYVGEPLPPRLPGVAPTSAAASSTVSSANDSSIDQAREVYTTFTVMSYNVLCQSYTAKYTYTPPISLALQFREQLALREIRQLNPSILCLQEVSGFSYFNVWLPAMRMAGYEGIFKQKGSAKDVPPSHVGNIDGCATFWRRDQFGLLEEWAFEYGLLVSENHTDPELLKSKDSERLTGKDQVGLIVVLRHLESSERVIVANTHIFWNPKYSDVKTIQACLLVEEVERTARRYQNPTSTSRNNQLATPLIICGDFNSTPSSDVYRVYSGESTLADIISNPESSGLHGRDYGRFTDPIYKWNIARYLSLKSAYSTPFGDGQRIPFTNYTPDFTAVIDYLWYSTATLSVEAVLEEVDPAHVKSVLGFPSEFCPSDHISIMAKFKLRINSGHY